MLSTGSVTAGRHGLPPSLLFRSPPRRGAVPFLAPFDPDRAERRGARSRLRIGNFLTFSGSPGIWGPAATNSALLAVSEINRRGGILGREIELSFYDSGGPVEDVAARARDALDFDDIHVVMGSHISAVRLALRRLTRGRIPYVYTPVYEGGERTPGVMAIGETPHSQTRPAIHWLAENKGARRWYLIGERLCLAVAIAPPDQDLYQRGRRPCRRRGVRPGRP
ncbi:ABC-type branched-subunit amino acid transport system substrate-binding protein [Bradyrhizobium sp. USDA 4369]